MVTNLLYSYMIQYMSERVEQGLRARRERRLKEEGLIERGWISTGDLPYAIGRKVPKMNSNMIANNIISFLKMVLEKQDDTYSDTNITKVGRKTFVSPELAVKIEEEVTSVYRVK